MLPADALQIRIDLDTSRFARDLQRSTQQVAAATQRMARSFDQVGKSMTSLGGEFTAKVTAPLGILGVTMIKTAGNFETAMISLRTLAQQGGATAEQLSGLETVARSLGKSTQFSATEVADAMFNMTQAGLDTKQVMEGVGSALDLAGASGMGIAEASNLLAKVMGSQGLASTELTHAVDVLTKAAVSTQTDLQSLGEAFRQAGPITKVAGVQFEYAAAALATMSRAGFESTVAGNALKRAMSQLASAAAPGEKATTATGRALRAMGVEAKNADGTLRPLADVLDELRAKSGNDIVGTFTKIFDTFAAGPMADLSGRTDELRQLFETLKTGSAGIAKTLNDAKLQGLNGQLEQMSGAFQELGIAIGESGVLKDITNFVRGVGEALDRLSALSPETLKWGASLAGIAAAIGPVLVGLGALAWSFGQILTVGGLLTAAVAGPLGLTAALVGAAAALAIWSQQTPGAAAANKTATAAILQMKDATRLYEEALLSAARARDGDKAKAEEQVRQTREQAVAALAAAEAALKESEAIDAVTNSRARMIVAATGGQLDPEKDYKPSDRTVKIQKDITTLRNKIAAGDAMPGLLAKLQDAAKPMMDALAKGRKPAAPATVAGGGGGGGDLSEDAQDAREALRLQVAELEALAKAAGISSNALERLRISQDILATGWESTASTTAGAEAELSAYVDRIMDANAAMDAAQGLERELERMGQARDAYRDAVTDREALIEAMGRGEDAYEREYLRQQLVADGMGDVNRRLEEQLALRKQEEAAGSEAALWSGIASSPFDALKQALASGEGTFRSVMSETGDRIGAIMLEELVFRPMDELAKQLARGLQNAFNEAGSAFMSSMNSGGGNSIWSAIGSAVGSLFGMGGGHAGTGAGTDVFDANALAGARAIGGPTLSGMPYLVGEKGPEVFIPSGSGTVEPMRNMKGGGASPVLNYSPTINADGLSMDEVNALMQQSEARMMQAFAGSFPDLWSRQLANAKKHGEDFSPRRR